MRLDLEDLAAVADAAVGDHDPPGRAGLPLGFLPGLGPVLAGEFGVDQRLPQLLRRRADVGHVDESRSAIGFSFQSSLELGEDAEAAALEFADPALGDLVDRHRVEIVQLLAAAPDVTTRFASSSIARCLVTACRVMSRCSQSSPSVCPLSRVQPSSKLAAARVGQRLEHLVESMAALCNHLVACQGVKSEGETVPSPTSDD